MRANRLVHQVTVTPKQGEGAYGPVYGSPVTLQARVEYGTGVTQDSSGQDITYRSRLFFAPEAESLLAPEAELTYRGQQLEIINVAPMSNLQGSITHIEVEAK